MGHKARESCYLIPNDDLCEDVLHLLDRFPKLKRARLARDLGIKPTALERILWRAQVCRNRIKGFYEDFWWYLLVYPTLSYESQHLVEYSPRNTIRLIFRTYV